MTERNLSIGVDIGGSHIGCAAVDMFRGEMIPGSESRLDVDSFADAGTVFTTWARAVNSTLERIDRHRLAGIGLAMPGPFDYRNGISKMEHKYPRLFGRDIIGELRHRFHVDGDARIRFLNDATSFAVGEAWLGKGMGRRKVLAITLGTGLGSAFIDDGIPVIDGENVPAEGCLWHLPFRYGVADQFFTTRWFVKAYADRSGGKVTAARDVAERADGGDPVALAIFERFGSNLAGFLAPWLRTFQADVFVMGGNITRAYCFFGPVLEQGLREAGAESTIEISEMKERAATIGAARLSDDDFWEKVSARLPSI
ncbi:MAG: ROK family protein [Xanthomonadales bacterium]|jgi:glucokinase|nr:ROK family protein [Xanthomonadales bacterium]